MKRIFPQKFPYSSYTYSSWENHCAISKYLRAFSTWNSRGDRNLSLDNLSHFHYYVSVSERQQLNKPFSPGPAIHFKAVVIPEK